MKRWTEDAMLTYTERDERDTLAAFYDRPIRWTFDADAILARFQMLRQADRQHEANDRAQELVA